jgi:hypothetical protein
MRWSEEFPGRIGNLCGIHTSLSVPDGTPWAIDNGKFAVWSSGNDWDANVFIAYLDKGLSLPRPPDWVVVPDEVGNAKQTFALWGRWARLIHRNYGFPLALAVQDGMIPLDVYHMRLDPAPDVIFVGGTARFKWRTLGYWCKLFPRVHVGRVNTERTLWMCHRAGAESSDGTGWFRGGPERESGLRRYLERSGAGKGEHDAKGLLY